jgi:hypothetical protein
VFWSGNRRRVSVERWTAWEDGIGNHSVFIPRSQPPPTMLKEQY